MTPDLDLLPAVWREAEDRYPPEKGWGLKIVRRWLTPNEAAWIVAFSRMKGGLLDHSTYVSGDAETPVAAFRALLDGSPEQRRQASIVHVQSLLDRAEAEAQSRRDQLAELVASKP